MATNGCTLGVQPFVAIGMVKVPMCVDQVLDRVGVDWCKGGCNLWTRTRKTGVDKQLTVAAGKDGDISASAHEDAYVAAEFLDDDGSGCCCFSRCLYESVI
jgi:hypothetical protein